MSHTSNFFRYLYKLNLQSFDPTSDHGSQGVFFFFVLTMFIVRARGRHPVSHTSCKPKQHYNRTGKQILNSIISETT